MYVCGFGLGMIELCFAGVQTGGTKAMDDRTVCSTQCRNRKSGMKGECEESSSSISAASRARSGAG
jgi:hypothetical protein